MRDQDLEAEMARLSQEARRELAREEAELPPRPFPEALRAGGRERRGLEERLGEEEREQGGPRGSLALTLALVAGVALALLLAWDALLAPLARAAAVLALLGLALLGALRLLRARS